MAGAPFEGPVSGVKIALTESGDYIFDPSFSDEANAKLHLVVAGTSDAITMVEAGGAEVSDKQMLDALSYAHGLIKEMCAAQEDFIKNYETQFGIEAITPTLNLPDESLYAEVQSFLTLEKLEVLYGTGKKEFQKALDTLDEETKNHLVTS